jgi:DNA-binding response OmpR family regulator
VNQDDRLRILFVDAEQRVLNSLRAMFRHDYDVITASKVHEALHHLNEAPVDVVVADERLPDTTGFDLLHWIRLRSPHSARILMLNAGTQSYDPAVVRRAQLFRVLSKPCPPDVLRATVLQAGRAARLRIVHRDGRQQVPAGGEPVVTGSDDELSAPLLAPDALDRPVITADPAQPEVQSAANDAPEATPASPVTDPTEDSGLHQTLTGTYRTLNLAAAQRAAEQQAAGSADDGEGSVAQEAESTSPPPGEPVADPASESQRIRRTWSVQGITVEEEHFEDPGDTARIFAGIVDDAARQRDATARDIGIGADAESAAAAPPAPALPPEPLVDEAPQSEDHEITLAGGHAPVDVIVLSADAITAEKIRRLTIECHRIHHAPTPLSAVDQLCTVGASVLLLDAARMPKCGVTRTARLLRQVAPDLRLLVLAPAVETGYYDVLDPALGIISMIHSPLTGDQLYGAIGWCSKLPAESGDCCAPVKGVPALEHSDGSLSSRWRRVSRLWSRS